MRNFPVLAAVLAITLAGAALALGSQAKAQPYGWGMMGPGGTMYGPGYGPGMMYGPGYGPGGPGYEPGMMYGPGYGHKGPWAWGPGAYGQGNLNLSTDDVKNYFDRRIAWQGNSRLKVGDINEKDADTIMADIVTKDNSSLVQRFIVNRHTGIYRPDKE